jgi:hypothetical protein
MAIKPQTLDRCRNAFDILTILLDRTPSQREVSRAVPASLATVSAVWDDLTADDTDDDPRPPQIATTRVCLGCRTPFSSRSAGNRICSRCRSRDTWRDATIEYSVMHF